MNEITIESPEFQAMYEEISKRAEAIRKREELSEESFRKWICEAVETLAKKMGYHIQNIYEFTLDMEYSFKKGFNAGREAARKNSYRNRKE
ncbi:MAG: hypothetical protein IJM37_07325 [Lachnospiraceae bacterium]|nr:hypothetical protein [Lachnospiraceae bacterium]